MTNADLAAPRDWLGHPRGLTVLFATEMWERFSYYGMRALLVLYMVDHLFKPEAVDGVVGLAGLKGALETVSGPLGAQPLASQIYGLYTGFVYLTPILGGLIADRWLGRRVTITIGAMLMVAGHFLMGFERWFLVALTLLILGNGAFKPNIVTQVGSLYADGDPRRDRAYSLFYVGINIGAFFSPMVCGTLAEAYGWPTGFAAAGVGMAVGLAIYLAGGAFLPAEHIVPRSEGPAAAAAPAPTEGLGGGRALLAVIMLFIPSALFWAAYEQQGNTIALWAEGSIDRTIDLGFWRGDIPVTWFQSFNPLMIFLLTPLVVGWWGHRAKSGREADTITKLAIGCFGVAFAYLVLAAAAGLGGAAPVSWRWLLVYFTILTVAELYFSPIGLSLVSQIAPERSRSALMGLWLATSFTGNLLAGWLGSFWSGMSHGGFFAAIAAVAALGGCCVLAARGPLATLVPHGTGAVTAGPPVP